MFRLAILSAVTICLALASAPAAQASQEDDPVIIEQFGFLKRSCDELGEGGQCTEEGVSCTIQVLSNGTTMCLDAGAEE